MDGQKRLLDAKANRSHTHKHTFSSFFDRIFHIATRKIRERILLSSECLLFVAMRNELMNQRLSVCTVHTYIYLYPL